MKLIILKTVALSLLISCYFSAEAATKTRIDCKDIGSDIDQKPQVTVIMNKGQIERTLIKNSEGQIVVDKSENLKPRVRLGSPYELFQVPTRSETLAIDQNFSKAQKFNAYLLWGNVERTPVHNPQILETYVCSRTEFKTDGLPTQLPSQHKVPKKDQSLSLGTLAAEVDGE